MEASVHWGSENFSSDAWKSKINEKKWHKLIQSYNAGSIVRRSTLDVPQCCAEAG